MIDAIRRCDRIGTAPEMIAGMARRFSVGAFRTRLLSELDAAMRKGS